MTRSVTDAHGFLGCQNRQDDAKRAKKRREALCLLCFSLNLCQSVKSVDLFLRNLRNLWSLLAKAEQLLFVNFFAAQEGVADLLL